MNKAISSLTERMLCAHKKGLIQGLDAEGKCANKKTNKLARCKRWYELLPRPSACFGSCHVMLWLVGLMFESRLQMEIF